MTKIFCIGINKTGSTSIHQAFQMLGIRSYHGPSKTGIVAEHLRKGQIHSILSQYDAFSDFPHMPPYRELKERFPDAKFILTTRPYRDWLISRMSHVLHNIVFDNHWWQYIDTEDCKKQYEQIHTEIPAFFKDDPNYLEINICAGEGWEKLCPFLGKPIPNKPFPYANTGKDRIAGIYHKMVQQAKERVQTPVKSE